VTAVTPNFHAGLATDFCVHYSAVDARRLGLTPCLSRPDAGPSICGLADAAWAEMAAAGVQRISDL